MTAAIITGSSGFVGSHLRRSLELKGREVLCIGRRDVDKFFSSPANWRKSPPTVFHLAGFVSPQQSFDSPHDAFLANVALTEKVLEFCRLTGAKMIFPSTSSYRCKRAGIRSNEYDERTIDNPYVLTKVLAEKLCLKYADMFSLDILVLRLFNVYGPFQSQEHLIPYLIGQVLKCRKVVVNDVESRRDFVFVSDVIRALESAEEYQGTKRVINIGSGKSTGIRELVDLIQEIWGIECVSVTQRNPRKIMGSMQADITVAAAELGWIPEVELKNGLCQIKNVQIS